MMMDKCGVSKISPEFLKSVLEYNPDTGEFRWKKRDESSFMGRGSRTLTQVASNFNAKHAGNKAANYKDAYGYWFIKVNGTRIPAHRAAWVIHHGSWPDQIDHINHDRGDNRIANLREACQGENMKNTSISTANKSGIVGVHWHKAAGKWCASIKSGRKSEHLGLFSTLLDAASVRRRKELEYGFHANHGQPAVTGGER